MCFRELALPACASMIVFRLCGTHDTFVISIVTAALTQPHTRWSKRKRQRQREKDERRVKFAGRESRGGRKVGNRGESSRKKREEG